MRSLIPIANSTAATTTVNTGISTASATTTTAAEKRSCTNQDYDQYYFFHGYPCHIMYFKYTI